MLERFSNRSPTLIAQVVKIKAVQSKTADSSQAGEKYVQEREVLPTHSLQRCESLVVLERLSNRGCTLTADAVALEAVQWRRKQIETIEIMKQNRGRSGDESVKKRRGVVV